MLSMACATTLKPGSYCYICCACIGNGALNLKDDGRFSMEYERVENRKDKDREIFYGEGTYRQEKGALELQFEDLPVIESAVVLTRMGGSEKIDIRIRNVFDPVYNTQVIGASLRIVDPSHKKAYATQSFHNDEEIHLAFDPAKNKLANRSALILEASFIGYYTASISLPHPGRYVADVTLPFGYADVRFTQRDHKKFKVKKTLDGFTIRDEADRKIYFTKKSCYCD
jgi:hypothetical protein